MALVAEISVQEYLRLNNSGAALLYDVRDADEHSHERIAHAINMPLSSFFCYDLDQINSDTILVFHCQSGNRTKLNANRFANLKRDRVYILIGGINAWKASGMETLKSDTAPLPIMRQVQMVAGMLILTGAILGYFIRPEFIGISAFVGIGLFFAGATGFCGMANLLMLLPYNKKQRHLNCATKDNSK